MSKFNEWFLSLPEERQKILREDKWMLAENAFNANLPKLDQDIIKRAYEVQKDGCYCTICDECILNNVICSLDYLGDVPADDAKILMSGFFIGLKFVEESKDK